MSTICIFCGKQVVFPNAFTCRYCGYTFCEVHRLAEKHDCVKTKHTQYLEKPWLRKHGLNITTGEYKIACYACKYESNETYSIEVAGDVRHQHIAQKGCPENMVKIRPTEETIQEPKAEQEVSQFTGEDPIWMYESLEAAKQIIKLFHKDGADFVNRCSFRLFFQTDKAHAYGYITLGMHPYYRIGIHQSLAEKTPQNQRMIVIVLVHELLHAIHPDWDHSKINPEEKRLANLGNYFDALHNMDVFYLSGKMSLCPN